MNEKFRGAPVEEDTKVLRRAVVTVGELEVLHEKWSWDGVRGETFVFVSSEISVTKRLRGWCGYLRWWSQGLRSQ